MEAGRVSIFVVSLARRAAGRDSAKSEDREWGSEIKGEAVGRGSAGIEIRQRMVVE